MEDGAAAEGLADALDYDGGIGDDGRIGGGIGQAQIPSR